MAEATADFTVTTWADKVWHDAAGVTLARVEVHKAFTGGVVGTSRAEIVTGTAGEAAVYGGLELLDVAVAGRHGTFVLHHDAAVAPDGTPDARWTVVPGSGTGQLSGIGGDATITRHPDGTHTFALRYDLPD